MTQKPIVSFRLKETPKRQAVGSNPAKCAICSVENPMKSGLFGAFSFSQRGCRRRGFFDRFFRHAGGGERAALPCVNAFLRAPFAFSGNVRKNRDVFRKIYIDLRGKLC